MTEETQEQENAPREEAPAAPGPPTAPPTEFAELPEAKRGLLSRLNPVRWFRRESPQSYVKEGLSLMENQNLALATMAFQKALSLDPNNVGGFKGLGNVLLRKGGRVNIGSALTYFQEAVKRDPFDDQAYAMSAKIFERLGRLKEATMERKKMVIVKTLHSDPTNHVANNNMGILMLQMEQADEAIKYFRKSIETNPDYDISHRNLAAVFYKLAISESDEKKKGDHVDQARGHVARALELGSNVTSMVINGKIMILDGRFEDALQIAEEAEVMHPANKDVYGLKRQALEKLHRTLEAQKAFDSYQTFSEEK